MSRSEVWTSHQHGSYHLGSPPRTFRSLRLLRRPWRLIIARRHGSGYQGRRGWRFRLHQPLCFRLKAGGGAGWLADRARWLVLIAAALEGGRAASLLGMTGAGCALLAGKYSRTCDAAAGPRRVHLGGVMWMHCVRLPRFPAAASLPARTGGFGNNGCTTSSRWQRLLEGNIKVCLCTQRCCPQTPGAHYSSHPIQLHPSGCLFSPSHDSLVWLPRLCGARDAGKSLCFFIDDEAHLVAAVGGGSRNPKGLCWHARRTHVPVSSLVPKPDRFASISTIPRPARPRPPRD